MAKATPQLHPKSAILNRRAVLAGGVAAAVPVPALATAAVPTGDGRIPGFELSPLGRELLAAILDAQAHTWCDPESGHLTDEVAGNKTYRRAHKRLRDEQWDNLQRLANRVMGQPLTLSTLADRALIVIHRVDDADDLTSYLPGAPAEDSENMEWSDHRVLLAAVAAMAGLPMEWPYERWDEHSGPADAQERIASMLGTGVPTA